MIPYARKGMALGPKHLACFGTVVVVGWSGGFGSPTLTRELSTTKFADLMCQIRVEPESNFVRLQAIVRVEKSSSGNYRFSVSKKTASGTSESQQSGTFALPARGERVLTTVVLDRSAVGHFHAYLSVDSDLGRVTCSAP